jgi:hypothetical protein
MRSPSSVTISTLTMSVPILISVVCIVACFGRVEMGRGPGIAGSDGSSQLDQAPWTSFSLRDSASRSQSFKHRHCVTLLPLPPPLLLLAHSASWGFSRLSVMPSSHAPSNPGHSPSHMTNASTTSSLAQRCSNAVAGLMILCPSPRSGRGLVRSASGTFGRCGPFGACRAVNRPLQQSISGFLAMASPRLCCMPSWAD